MNIGGQIIFDPSPLIVIGAGTFVLKFGPDLEAIEKKLAHIIPDFIKVFNGFLKTGHGGNACLSSFSYFITEKRRFATFFT